MKALRKLVPGGGLHLEDIEQPKAQPGHVVLKVQATGICGTDIHILHDEFPSRPPVTLGHEVSGEIAELGTGVGDWQVGDRVITETYYIYCGHCEWCRNGRPNLCVERRSIGSMVNGGFAEYLEVPARNLHRIPDHVSWETAALTEPLACVVHGVNRAGVRPGEWVVVSGPGPIGMLTVQVAQAAGGRVIVVGIDQDTDRLRIAESLGVEAVLNVQSAGYEDTVQRVQELTSGGAHVVFECAGAAASGKFLFDVVRKRGRYGQIGLYGKPVPMNLDTVCYKELTVTGTNASIPETWPQALDLLSRGVVKAEPIVSGTWTLTEWQQAFDKVEEKGALKVIIAGV